MTHIVRCLLTSALLVGIFACCGNNKRNLERHAANATPITNGLDSPIVDMVDSSPVSQMKHFNVYLENSGSMNGYVKGNTGFEQAVYYYLTQIVDNEVVDVINLFYINSKVIPLGNDIESFIHHVEPADFQKRGGKLGSSDIAVALDTILN